MTMTDPIADMLTRVRNGNQAYHDSVSMPFSKLKAGVAEILPAEGYISPTTGRARGGQVRPHPVVTLKYGPSRERSIAACGRISKPASGCTRSRPDCPRSSGGLGVAIISTSQGLLTDRRRTRRAWAGSLAYVW
jgi:small subunit ribosomal protein S8